MDIYTEKSRWKLYLFITAMLLLAISIVYTNYIASRLAEGERNKADLWAKTMEKLSQSEDLTEDLTYEQQVLSQIKNIPVMLVSETGKITSHINFPKGTDLEKELDAMKKSKIAPIKIVGDAGFVYYKHTRLLTLLSYFPIVQVLFFALFTGIAYFLFSSARRSEQNQVWVGMAKETAHQLGTPITSIVGWIDHLRTVQDNEEVNEILDELGNDVARLNLIADRFSKIGSAPKLEAVNVYEQLQGIKKYMQRRASRRVKFEWPDSEKVLNININPPLFDWVIENLLRNALDAMDGKGTISAKVIEEGSQVCIEISDTGKGIEPNKFKTVFEPGFTTKKRGWGLGLSLAKRIIESYHSGKIFVKSSIVKEGTTFAIKLPKA